MTKSHDQQSTSSNDQLWCLDIGHLLVIEAWSFSPEVPMSAKDSHALGDYVEDMK